MHPTPASAATTGTAALRRVLPWLLLSLAIHLPLLHWAALERDSPFRQWQPFHVQLVEQQAHGSRDKQPAARPEASTPLRQPKTTTTPSAKARTATAHSMPGASPQRAAPQRVDDAAAMETKPTVAAESRAASRPQGRASAASPSSEEHKAGEEPTEQALLTAVRLALARHFHYPRMAMRRGWQGEVILAFQLQADGTIVNARIAQSSGYSVLDRAALHALGKVNRIRNTLRGNRAMQLPVIYRLEG